MAKSKNAKLARKMASIKSVGTNNKAQNNFNTFMKFLTDKLVTNMGKVCNDTYAVESIPVSTVAPYGGVYVVTSKTPCGVPWLGDYKCKKGDILYPATATAPAIVATKDRDGYNQSWNDNDFLEICGIQPEFRPLMANVVDKFFHY